MSKEQTPKEYRNNIHYWNETMSKEQTPIERLKEEIERSEILSDDTKRILSLIDWNRKIQEEEEFTNAKVLEALEREVIDSHKHGEVCKKGIGSLTTRAVEYYETEVKPKYKQINK